MNETQAIAVWRKKYPADVILKLHGGRFQASLPDLIHITSTGQVNFLEVKSVSGLTLPWSKCRLDQHLMLRKIRKTGASALYLVWSNASERFYLVDPMGMAEGESTHLEGCQV